MILIPPEATRKKMGDPDLPGHVRLYAPRSVQASAATPGHARHGPGGLTKVMVKCRVSANFATGRRRRRPSSAEATAMTTLTIPRERLAATLTPTRPFPLEPKHGSPSPTTGSSLHSLRLSHREPPKARRHSEEPASPATRGPLVLYNTPCGSCITSGQGYCLQGRRPQVLLWVKASSVGLRSAPSGNGNSREFLQ